MTQRKLRSKKDEKRTVAQYCSYCKKTFDMPVVEEAEDQEVIWLKCPGCSGYLPLMLDQEDMEAYEEEDSAADESSEPVDVSLEDLDIEKAREYHESNLYEIGEVIYHRSWNDYGKVLAKETLPGNRKAIVVQFVNQGRIKLLEGVV